MSSDVDRENLIWTGRRFMDALIRAYGDQIDVLALWELVIQNVPDGKQLYDEIFLHRIKDPPPVQKISPEEILARLRARGAAIQKNAPNRTYPTNEDDS